jgi:hypothetical protein
LAQETDPEIEDLSGPADLRAVQHRVRNDLQTVGALWRLARRRSTPEELVEEFPSWLAALAAVYDAVPLTHAHNVIPFRAITCAIRGRCLPSAPIKMDYAGDPCLPGQMGIVGALAITAFLSHSVRCAVPGTTICVRVEAGERCTRMESVFTATEEPLPAPPLGLSVAADAAGARFGIGREGDQTMAVLVIPCP